MTTIEAGLPATLQARVRAETAPWLVTGAAGFIGSNLVETLLRLGQRVVGLDNFATGHQRNLDEVRQLVGEEAWSRFRFIKGDIRRPEDCQAACAGVRHVLHQAALGSVPRSIEDPVDTHSANVTGFLNMLVAARDAGVASFTYAASSSTYGDEPTMPKVEDRIGRPLSPYAATKLFNEMSRIVADHIYDGRLFDPTVRAALSAIDVLSEPATGTVELGMYKGNLYFQSLKRCPGSLYNEADASMEKSEGLNPTSSQGYVEIQAVEAKALARAGQIKA